MPCHAMACSCHTGRTKPKSVISQEVQKVVVDPACPAYAVQGDDEVSKGSFICRFAEGFVRCSQRADC
jgi:hypothetical protein